MRRVLLWLLVMALVASACDRSESVDTTTTTVPPTVEEILVQATEAMERAETLRYAIDLTGAPITLLGVELRGADGQYAAPNASQALLRAAVGGLVIELGTIAIGDTAWLTNPLSGDWDRYTGDRAFNPAIIFDPEIGWRPLLTEDFSNGTLVETRLVDGSERYVLSGMVADRRVEVLTAGLVDAQPLTLIMEVEAGTGYITRMEFTTVGDAGETVWTLDLSEFGDPVTIEPPVGA